LIRYLDASAQAKTYVEEEGSDLVRRWVRSGAVWVSRLGLVEVHSALVRLSRAGHITRSQFRVALAAMEADSRRIPIAELDPAVGDMAIRLLRDHPLRGADAVHLASALGLKERLGTVTFASWDARLNRAASAEGLPVEGG